LVLDDRQQFPPRGDQDPVLSDQVRGALDGPLEETLPVEEGWKLLRVTRRRERPEPLAASTGQDHNEQSIHLRLPSV
jgi:hypothetical protein